MALDHQAYQDPLKYLIYRESKTCAGCEHKKDLVLMGKTYELCTKGKNPIKRCKHYREIE